MRRSRIPGRHARVLLAASLLAFAALPLRLGVLAPVDRPPPAVALTCSSVELLCATFTVDALGPGSGTIVDRSEPPILNCTITAGVESGACSVQYEWPVASTYNVELDITPATGSFVCLSSEEVPCSVEGAVRTFQESLADQAEEDFAVAKFDLATRTVAVTVTGPGAGIVSDGLLTVCPPL